MNTITKYFIAIFLVSFVFASCKKSSNKVPSNGALGPNFPAVVNTIITPAILDTLQKHGTVINAGLTPASANGIYLFQPAYCTYDNSGEDIAGSTIGGGKFKFADQNNTAFTVSEQYTFSDGDETGSDNAATYISGSGKLFTVYANATGTSFGINYNALEITSGEVTDGGVKNLQFSYYLVSKVGDADNSVLVPTGTIRVFEDMDKFSETQSTFSIPARRIQSINAGKIGLFLSKSGKKN